MEITQKEELAQLLRVEYGFYDLYKKQYLDGRLPKEEARKKIRNQCIHIANLKKQCRADLADDLPEEYFLPAPELFEQLPAARNPPGGSETEAMANGEYKQADIFDFIGEDGSISWT